MAYFNAVHGWPSFDALTETAPFSGTIPEGRIVTKNNSGVFVLVGGGTPAARTPYVNIYNSTDPDIAKTSNDAALYPNSLVAQAAYGTSGGNLATLSLAQSLEFETDQFLGTPTVNTLLTWEGVAVTDVDSADYGKLRAAVSGEPIVARVTRAAFSPLDQPTISVIRVTACAYGQIAP